MGRIIYINDPYRVRIDRRGYKLFNYTDEDNYHGHLKSLKTCMDLICMMNKNVVPDKPKLRECVLRVTRDDKYKENVLRKIEKDREKPDYFNVNKGVRTWIMTVT